MVTDMFSRRRVLGYGSLGVLSTAAVLTSAGKSEATQLAQAQVAYQPQPNGDKRCALCEHFVAPNACKLVTGPISAQGWCKLFSAKA